MGLFTFSFITLVLGVLAFPAEEEFGLEKSSVATNAVKDDLETSDTYGLAYYPGYYGGGVGSNIIPGPGFGVGAIAPTPLLTTSLLATPVFSSPIVGPSYNPSYSTSFPGTSVKVRPHISYDHGNTYKYGGSYGYSKGIPINEYQRRQPVYIGLN